MTSTLSSGAPVDATLLIESPLDDPDRDAERDPDDDDSGPDAEAWPGQQADDLGVVTRPVVSDAAPGSNQRLMDGFDSVTTRLVFVIGPDHRGGGNSSIELMVDHAERMAEHLGLADLPIPLLMLTAWRDVEVTAIYRAWLANRHPDLFAQHEQDFDTYLSLLGVRAVDSALHGADVVENGTVLRLVGRCRRGGTDGPSPTADLQPVVILLDESDTIVLSATTTPFLTADGTAPSWIGFTADIPLSSLPVGRFRLATDIERPRGLEPHRARMKATVGLLGSSRVTVSGGRRFQILQAGDTFRADVLSQDSEIFLAGLRWSLAMFWLDIKAVLRLRRFAVTRLLRLVTRPLFAPLGPIWLVGERTDTARDNGYHLFAYLRRERPDIRAYYVIDRQSDQYDKIAALGRVITHSSWRHKLLSMHVTVLVSAYSLKYLLPNSWDPGAYVRQLVWRMGTYRVYLKHGINDKMLVKRRTNGFDLYFTGVKAETLAARNGSGYDHQIEQAGLARFDALVPTPPSRTILFMPTWRSYLVPKLFSDLTSSERQFEGSAYQRFMLEFLASDRLRDILDASDYRLQFMPHYNLAEQLSDAPTNSDRIDLIDAAAADIQDIMRGCDLFITDYSSVHFDLAYLGTPLIYTHFDREDFQSGHAQTSWFVHETDGFGPVAYDVDGTLDALEAYLDNGCAREQVYDDRAAEAFAHRDTRNCERTTQAIERLIATRGIH